MRKWPIVGSSFEHAHMVDLLREVYEHPNAEIAGVSDNDKPRMTDAIAKFSIPTDRVYGDLVQAHLDLAILCPATARQAEVFEEVAALGVDILLEKPFAASLADADRILAAIEKSGCGSPSTGLCAGIRRMADKEPSAACRRSPMITTKRRRHDGEGTRSHVGRATAAA
jgi:hypothetical protein